MCLEIQTSARSSKSLESVYQATCSKLKTMHANITPSCMQGWEVKREKMDRVHPQMFQKAWEPYILDMHGMVMASWSS